MLCIRRSVRPFALAALTATLSLVVLPESAYAQAPSPPGQPASGPGGADYQWGTPTQVFHDVPNSDVKDYWTFEPAGWSGPGDQPTTAPVVVFLHGYNASNPTDYQAWLTHLARKGNLVIFPRFQTRLTLGSEFTANAIWAIRDGLSWLNANATVKPSTGNGLVAMGHSYGGVVAVNYANRASAEGLPAAAAILPVFPYTENMDNLGSIPASSKLVCVVDDEDMTTGRTGCDVVWERTGHMTAENRNYVWMFSDTYGEPDLRARHSAPHEFSPEDALDFYGFWKLGDGLRNCVILGTDCEYGIGLASQQRAMGAWSDGTAVREVQPTLEAPACPSGSKAKGCLS